MITATILTKNNQKTVKQALESLKNFDEVIILDSGSTDETLKIAEQFPNVTIHKSPFLGFGPMHNYASKLATNDWILSLDSDEALSPTLIEEIKTLELDPQKIYSIQRHNYFNKKHIKWCGGWHPDFIVRLYNRKTTRFSDDLVHEKVEPKNLKVITLKNPINHTPYVEISDFIDKIQHYSNLFVEQNEGKKVSTFHAILHGWHAFFKSYVLKRGFMGGKEGFVISIYNGHAAFYKYLKLSEKA